MADALLEKTDMYEYVCFFVYVLQNLFNPHSQLTSKVLVISCGDIHIGHGETLIVRCNS